MREFKEGDKLLCCRKFDHLNIGKYYEIDMVLECINMIAIHINGFWFSLTKNKSSYPYVYDYFFTEKEERKIKLQILKLHSKI